MNGDERDDVIKMALRILFAALRAECKALRDIPQPESETGIPARSSTR